VPASPAKPGDPASPAKPGDPAKPAKPSDPAKPAKLTEPASPAKPLSLRNSKLLNHYENQSPPQLVFYIFKVSKPTRENIILNENKILGL